MTQNSNKVKKIIIRYEMKGQGIVNYDSDEQKFILIQLGLGKEFVNRYDNGSYAKKAFFMKPDGSYGYKVKISSACLKKHMFQHDIVSQQGSVQHMPHLNMSLMASPLQIINGYLQTTTGEMALSRTSSFNLTDAMQSNNAKSTMEFFSKSGDKGMVKESEEDKAQVEEAEKKKSSNSIHRKETVGQITYSGEGEISIKQLEFMSVDDIFGRLALKEGDFDLFSHYAKLQVPNFNSKLGYYRMKNSCDLTPEYGFVFNNDNKNFFVKYILERMLGLQIVKNKAKAHISKIEIKFVYDPIEDNFDSEEGWIQLSSRKDLEDMYVQFDEFYVEENEEEAKALRAELERIQKEISDAVKAKSKQNAKEKKAKKEKSTRGEETTQTQDGQQ